MNLPSLLLFKVFWDFPGGPVVGTLPSNAGSEGLNPGRGAKISHASRPKNQNVNQKQYCNKFNKDFKKLVHIKKKKTLKKKSVLRCLPRGKQTKNVSFIIGCKSSQAIYLLSIPYLLLFLLSRVM